MLIVAGRISVGPALEGDLGLPDWVMGIVAYDSRGDRAALNDNGRVGKKAVRLDDVSAGENDHK